MKISLFTRGKQSHSFAKEMAFVGGLERHGISAEIKSWTDQSNNCDLAVFWSIYPTRIINDVKKNGGDFLVLENGYIGDRSKWISAAFNGLNGRGDFVLKNADNKRVNKMPCLPKTRETYGDKVFVMGQLKNDASVRGSDHHEWISATYEALKKHGHDVEFKPHPLDTSGFSPENCTPFHGTLNDALDLAECVVTYNSNSGVDAVMAGVPTISMDAGSMVYDITSHNISDVGFCKNEGLREWFNYLSYSQWTIEEFSSGETWEHLRGYYG